MFVLIKQKNITDITRQSEMANTSPRHMTVLGNVHPIKIENFDIFFVTSFLSSLEFLYFELIGLPKRFPGKIFENK